MLPTPPSPSMNSILLIPWGAILGMRLWESRIKALNILDGAIGAVNSWVKVVTPMTVFKRKDLKMEEKDLLEGRRRLLSLL